MKLSVEAYAVTRKLGDAEAFRAIKNAGFDAVDYSYYWENETDTVLGDGYSEYALYLRSLLDKTGLSCNQAHAPFSFKYGEKTNPSEPSYLRLVRSIESASVLGAKSIVVHSINVPENENFTEYNLEFYKGLLPLCEKYGIRLAVENLFRIDLKRKHPIGKLGTPAELNGMIEMLDSEYAVACVDVGHASLTGYEPERFLAQVTPEKLCALHIQDTDYISDLHTVPYNGALNWNAVMSTLKSIGYKGELTMEIFNFLGKFPPELIPAALGFANAVGRHLISIYDKS